MNRAIDAATPPAGCAFWQLCRLLEQLRDRGLTAAHPVQSRAGQEAAPPALVYRLPKPPASCG